MKTSLNKENNYYSLFNNENYKKDFDYDINDITEKISELLIEYYKFITENIKLTKSQLYQFIIIRGLDTIIHIFNFIFLYSKNLEMTCFHCQRAYYFYVEFVGQISEDEKTFLQLSSRDAIIYVYKKTIFEISSDIKKNNEIISEYSRLKLDIINKYIEFYKIIFLKLINNNIHEKEMNKNNQQIVLIRSIFKKLNNLNNKSNIGFLNELIENLYHEVEDINHFLNICLILSKKINKNNDILNNLKTKILSENFKDNINKPIDKLILWITN
jgi:hypothetical protein